MLQSLTAPLCWRGGREGQLQWRQWRTSLGPEEQNLPLAAGRGCIGGNLQVWHWGPGHLHQGHAVQGVDQEQLELN